MAGTVSPPDMDKQQRHNMGAGKDMISDLPDCILHYILSFLPPNDVVTTCILAKRWRYLWTYLSVLHFEALPLPYNQLYVSHNIRFPCLKTLNLSHITFANENSVEIFFSGCPVLQELTLDNCYWENLTETTIASSTLRMLTININPWCLDDCNNRTIKIDAVNLLSLSCTCQPTIEFVIVNPTNIVDAHIDLTCCYLQDEKYAAHCAFQLLSALHGVKSLTLSSGTIECLSYAEDTVHLLPLFHNLSHVNVFQWTAGFSSDTLVCILLEILKLKILISKGIDIRIHSPRKRKTADIHFSLLSSVNIIKKQTPFPQTRQHTLIVSLVEE